MNAMNAHIRDMLSWNDQQLTEWALETCRIGYAMSAHIRDMLSWNDQQLTEWALETCRIGCLRLRQHQEQVIASSDFTALEETQAHLAFVLALLISGREKVSAMVLGELLSSGEGE